MHLSHATLLLSPILVIALSPLPAGVAGGAASQPARAEATTPAAQFAADVGERLSVGWHLRDILVDDGVGGVRMSVTLAGGTRARRYILGYSADGRVAVSYRNRPAAMPSVRRVYRGELELADMLAVAPPTSIVQECGQYYLDGGDAGVTVNEDDFYVVERRAVGRLAERLLVEALSDGFESGLDLVSATPSRDNGGTRDVTFVLDGAEKQEVYAALDDEGHVGRVEVRVSPPGRAWQTYRPKAALLASLQAGRAIRSLSLQAGAGAQGQGRLVGTMRGGRRFVVDLAGFEPAEFECPC